MSKKKSKDTEKRTAEGTGLPNLTDISNVVSAYGTTGMIPSLPQHDWEYENYQDLASMEIPKVRQEKKQKSKEDKM